MTADDLVPEKQRALLLDRAHDEVALVDPGAAMADVALVEDRVTARRQPADHLPGRIDEPRAPAIEVERELRDVREGRDHARGGVGSVLAHPYASVRLDDAAGAGQRTITGKHRAAS
jgi:hypothetical protein